MNVPPGRYSVEAFVWNLSEKRTVVTGPHLLVEVLERMQFFGGVQLNSRWTVEERPPRVAGSDGPPPLERNRATA
jgi:hypothetical protein